MVAEYAGVHAEYVHHFLLHSSPVKIEVESALHGIAGIDNHHVLFCRAYAVDNGLAPHHAAKPVAPRLYLRMRVVGVEYHKFVVCLLFAGSERRGGNG